MLLPFPTHTLHFLLFLCLFLVLFHLQGNKLGQSATTALAHLNYLFLFLPLKCHLNLQKCLTDSAKSLQNKGLQLKEKCVRDAVKNQNFISYVIFETLKPFFLPVFQVKDFKYLYRKISAMRLHWVRSLYFYCHATAYHCPTTKFCLLPLNVCQFILFELTEKY